MPAARSLADLMRIRAHNRSYLESLNGTLGTALGFKRHTGEPTTSDEPAILVFVPEKINRKWVAPNDLIKHDLSGPNGLTCPLDVIAGSKAMTEMESAESGSALAQRLRGWDERIWCGSQISTAASGASEVVYGTLGAFVRRRSDNASGFITNDHVLRGVTVYHPWVPNTPGHGGGIMIAVKGAEGGIVEASLDEWYGEFAREADTVDSRVRVDCAFARLTSSVKPSDLSPEPLLRDVNDSQASATPPQGPWGEVFKISLEDDMASADSGVIGREVYRVGRTTGVRRGYIRAFAYEWFDRPGQRRTADFLIGGESFPVGVGVEASLPFSLKGDSGSVVFLWHNRERRPIALLWGGWQEQLRGGDSQENWSYATRLDKILEKMGLQLITKVTDFPNP